MQARSLLLILTITLFSFSLRNEEIHTLFVIGDSTASDYSSSSYPRTGWGTTLELYFDESKIEVDNRALSGRSSKSFYNENGAWNSVISSMQAGDFLIIQFGHNDQKSDVERATDPYTTYQEYLKKYIDEARAKGAIPILATSIHRNGWSGTSIKDSHGDYPPAMRALATEENVPLLDLHVRTKNLFENLGEDFTSNEIFLNLQPGDYPSYPDGNSDNTHLQEYGALKVSQLAIDAIIDKSADFNELEPLKNAIVEIGYVEVEVNSTDYGSVSGSGYNALEDSVTLIALPKSGYALSEWKVDGETVSDQNEYTFYLNSDSALIEAIFAVGYRVSVLKRPSFGGTVTGTGSYVVGRDVSLSAIPNDEWFFESWKIDDEVISTDPNYSFAMGNENLVLEANFTDVEIILNTPANDDPLIEIRSHHLIANSHIKAIEIVNISGQTLYDLHDVPGLNISFQNWKPGIYIVKWQNDESKTGTLKFLIR